MIILDAPNKTFQLSLVHAGNRNEIPWMCCYKSFTPGKPDSELFITATGLTNGSNSVVVMPGPKGNGVNELIVFSLVNTDNGRNVAALSIFDGKIYTPVISSIIRVGRTLFFPRDKSFLLYSTSGIS